MIKKFIKLVYPRFYYRKVLDIYRNVDDQPDITYEQLSSLPYNKVLDVYPNSTQNAKGIRVDTKSNTLCVRLEIEKGTQLLCHKHSDCSEVILLLSGKLVNLVNGSTVGKYRVMEISQGEFHCIKALEDTIAYIEFTKTTIYDGMVTN